MKADAIEVVICLENIGLKFKIIQLKIDSECNDVKMKQKNQPNKRVRKKYYFLMYTINIGIQIATRS